MRITIENAKDGDTIKLNGTYIGSGTPIDCYNKNISIIGMIMDILSMVPVINVLIMQITYFLPVKVR